jgi:hypothetical protein
MALASPSLGNVVSLPDEEMLSVGDVVAAAEEMERSAAFALHLSLDGTSVRSYSRRRGSVPSDIDGVIIADVPAFDSEDSVSQVALGQTNVRDPVAPEWPSENTSDYEADHTTVIASMVRVSYATTYAVHGLIAFASMLLGYITVRQVGDQWRCGMLASFQWIAVLAVDVAFMQTVAAALWVFLGSGREVDGATVWSLHPSDGELQECRLPR